jgi:pyrroloquinoline quinone biosynthesis protein D
MSSPTTPGVAKRVRTIITSASQPAMPNHIKLRHDAGRGRWHVLAPERVFEPDDIAVEILKQCDGVRSVEAIANVLAKDYNAPLADILADTISMLQDLADKGVVKA